MTGPFADRVFRTTFVLAGAYNLSFGLWAGFSPLHFFTVLDLDPPRYPSIWACLGMVVGVYGLLYWYAAWKPDRARPIIAIGLLGKVLGPVGMMLTLNQEWPSRVAMLSLYNDVIWWLPFTLFLVRDQPVGRRIASAAPWCCCALHALALGWMALVLQGGTLTQPDVRLRAAYIADHVPLWAAGWGCWMLSAIALIALYAWWGSRLATPAAHVGLWLGAAGMLFDLSGESLSILLLTEYVAPAVGPAAALWDPSRLLALERLITLLTAGAANLLYTLGGLILMLATPALPVSIRRLMWVTWISGFAMSAAAAADYVPAMVASTSLLFPSLIVWTGWMGWRWSRA